MPKKTKDSPNKPPPAFSTAPEGWTRLETRAPPCIPRPLSRPSRTCTFLALPCAVERREEEEDLSRAALLPAEWRDGGREGNGRHLAMCPPRHAANGRGTAGSGNREAETAVRRLPPLCLLLSLPADPCCRVQRQRDGDKEERWGEGVCVREREREREQ
jgi:hypothetical protein